MGAGYPTWAFGGILWEGVVVLKGDEGMGNPFNFARKILWADIERGCGSFDHS